MSRHFLGGCTAICLSAFAAQGAFAEVTAQDVWSEWKGYLESLGYEVSGTEEVAGGTLTVTGFGIAMQFPEDAGQLSVGMEQLVFSETADGAVSVTMPETIPVRIDPVDGSDRVAVRIDVTQADPAMTVSGSPQDMTYQYAASQMGIVLASLTVNGEPLPPELGYLTVSLGDIETRTNLRIGQGRSYSQEARVARVTYDLGFNDPESEDYATLKGTLEGLRLTGSGKIPAGVDPSDPGQMLASGFAVDGVYAYAASRFDLAGNGDGEEFSVSGGSQGGEISFAMDAGRIAYGVSQKAPAMDIATAELPFPLTLKAAGTGFSLEMPLRKSEELQPFGLSLRLAGFEMAEQLWSLFDPAGILPHDPATLVLDVTGMAKLLHDLLDPETAAMLDRTGAAPGELHALKINDLEVTAVGASLKGQGEFTFDNSDLRSFDGLPRPEGTAYLTLSGANALIDRLIQMGLIKDDEAMGFRMMLGMLTVPGNAPDTLTSTIEINAQGQILANGQRIK